MPLSLYHSARGTFHGFSQGDWLKKPTTLGIGARDENFLFRVISPWLLRRTVLHKQVVGVRTTLRHAPSMQLIGDELVQDTASSYVLENTSSARTTEGASSLFICEYSSLSITHLNPHPW